MSNPAAGSKKVLMKDPQQILQHVFGFPDFGAPQDEIISTLVDGGDFLVLMPTGGGKSLCWLFNSGNILPNAADYPNIKVANFLTQCVAVYAQHFCRL